MNAVKLVSVESIEKRKPVVRKYMLQTNGYSYIFREHLVSGYTPCGVPEGAEIMYRTTTSKAKKKIPYLKYDGNE
tara:strand:- start:14891 stop:15115 length:225 start_codon:yes stop_codon:yes gene_type:complete